MADTHEELLQPSLGNAALVARAPYSVPTVILTGVIGGPIAAIAIVLLNSQRLRRLRRDMLPLGAMALIAVATVWMTIGPGQELWFSQGDSERLASIVVRASGLLLAVLGVYLHSHQERTAALMGLTRPNGWLAGIACILVGWSVPLLGIALLAAGLE